MSNKYTNADGKIPTKYLPPKFSLTIRILVGAYVIYLSYGLMDGVVGGEGRDKYFLGIFMVAFAVIGLLLVFFSGRDLLRGKYVGGEMDAGEGETETAENAETKDCAETTETILSEKDEANSTPTDDQ